MLYDVFEIHCAMSNITITETIYLLWYSANGLY